MWLAGLPFFFLFLFVPVIPFLHRSPGPGAARYADGKPQAARTSAPGMRPASPKRAASDESEMIVKGSCIPKTSN